MINFDKQEIKKQISLDQVFELLQDWGGDPEYTSFGILSATICHNSLDNLSYLLGVFLKYSLRRGIILYFIIIFISESGIGLQKYE
jgi:hypothetical protein